jgi:hypothetical protein
MNRLHKWINHKIFKLAFNYYWWKRHYKNSQVNGKQSEDEQK